ncbi:hypothetical protein C8Q80DRAFT_748908 [Daedaleopsis nitida]|nr:hypothetical protein C8Q80DRAFT_748908 [Daedaleopsis nitida]
MEFTGTYTPARSVSFSLRKATVSHPSRSQELRPSWASGYHLSLPPLLVVFEAQQKTAKSDLLWARGEEMRQDCSTYLCCSCAVVWDRNLGVVGYYQHCYKTGALWSTRSNVNGHLHGGQSYCQYFKSCMAETLHRLKQKHGIICTNLENLTYLPSKNASHSRQPLLGTLIASHRTQCPCMWRLGDVVLDQPVRMTYGGCLACAHGLPASAFARYR